MCFKDFPRTRTFYIVTITFFKTTARKTCTNVNTSYHISLEYELDDRGRQELFKNFDFHKKTNIKIQTNISYSTIEDNTENISLVIISLWQHAITHVKKNTNFLFSLWPFKASILILTCSEIHVYWDAWLGFETKVCFKDLKAKQSMH